MVGLLTPTSQHGHHRHAFGYHKADTSAGHINSVYAEPPPHSELLSLTPWMG